MQIVATAALFLAAKVEEQHRRVKHLIDASYCVLHGTDRPPFEEASVEWRTRRDGLLETERILLYTLEFDVAIEQPYGMVTTQLRRWRDGGVFGSRFDKIPELAALDRAAAALIFAWCVRRQGVRGEVVCAIEQNGARRYRAATRTQTATRASTHCVMEFNCPRPDAHTE